MTANRIKLLSCVVAVCALMPLSAVAQDVFDLDIGDPARRDRRVAVSLDVITDTASGNELTPAELAAGLADVRLLLVGESHTNIEMHRAQLAVVQALVEAGREVVIGLEMYPYTEQAHLDAWTGDLLTESGFVKLSRWYDNWGYNWGYYREIFEYARHTQVPMVAINTPREVVSAVREKGFEGLSAAEAQHVPPRVDTSNEDHLRLFRAYMGPPGGGHEVSDEALFSMFEAQCTWDATMGYNAVKALEARPDAIMVVLVGSGHVAYGLGIQRQAELWFDDDVATLIPVEVSNDGSEREVQATYADFVWGVPAEASTLYPSLDFSTRQAEPGDPIEIIIVSGTSRAGEAGVQIGDHLISIDGAPIVDRETMKRTVAAKRWGDRIVLGLQRDGEAVQVDMVFRRR